MAYMVQFTLKYSLGSADDHEIDLYDVAHALIGFQRSLALTTHLVLNNEIITQATSLKGAQITTFPSEEGSWKMTAAIGLLAHAIYLGGTAPKDTPLGHIVASVYDYVVSETLGFHVDYDKTIGQAYEEMSARSGEVSKIRKSKIDSLAEKCEVAIREMHRPIVFSETAAKAEISVELAKRSRPIGRPLSYQTYDYIRYFKEDNPREFIGRISSYNINTYKGRVYIPDEERPIPFELAEEARGLRTIAKITRSLTDNAKAQFDDAGNIRFFALARRNRSDRLLALLITKIQ